jgi:coenzyme F420-reducing hydrogenase beta subunit
MKFDIDGFRYPVIDKEKCVGCNLCKMNCPVNKPIEKEEFIGKGYACYNTTETIRRMSTSGGIFFALAAYVIETGKGVVFGAAFDSSYNVEHVMVEKIEELRRLQGSKYVQSYIGETYIQAKRFLEKGRMVLFSGTPCQIAGLKAFLGKSYVNLYCVDFACFGVPSPIVWKRYLDEYYGKNKIRSIVFKDKIIGWKNWNVKIETEKRTDYYLKLFNPYMRIFLRGINIRESCLNCTYKGLNKYGDITIADAWGEPEKNKNLNDDGGLSAVLIHTEKGQQLFSGIIASVRYEEYDTDVLFRGNWAMYKSPNPNPARIDFRKELSKKRRLKQLINKYCKMSIKEKMGYYIKKKRRLLP